MIANVHVPPPGAFVLDTTISLDSAPPLAALARIVGDRIDTIDAHRIAVKTMGDSIYANLFMLGLAWQKGTLPIGLAALARAIELNGAAVAANQQAFALGRLAAADPRAFDPAGATSASSQSPDELISDRRTRLVAYQDEAYAGRYDRLVSAAAAADRRLGDADRRLATAVARNLHKLMAYKDEYEVARLYTDGSFERALAATLEDGGRREIHLSPPLFARRDPVSGLPRKYAFGPWIFKAFAVLARFKGLRGTRLDPFGYSAERRLERQLITQYEQDMHFAIERLSSDNADTVLALANLPDDIRGFGHVKHRHIVATETRRQALLATLRASTKEEAVAWVAA